MSAYIVSKKTIDSIVRYASRHDMRWSFKKVDSPELANQLGQILWAENHRSVNHRYHENDATPEYTYEPSNAEPTDAVQFIKLLQCVRYQSCECPDFGASEAANILESFLYQALSNLPGYDDAKWGF